MRDRRLLSQDGLMVVCLTFDSKTGELVTGPDIISRGFVYVRESDQLIEEVKKVVLDYLSGCEASRHSDWGLVKNGLRTRLKDFLYTKTKRTPMILPILIEV